MNEILPAEQSQPVGDRRMVKIIYILYLLAFFAGVTAVVGMVLAYVYRDGVPDWLRSHYDFQVRTFWIMLLYCAVAGVLTVIVIGFLLYALAALWWIVRCAKGYRCLDRGLAYPNPRGWGL